MTKVRIYKEGSDITGIECDGHTGYGVEGEDIVCAALSSIVQTAVLGILQVAKIDAEYKVDERKGYLRLTLPSDMSKDRRHDANVILNTLFLGISDLYQSFSDFIELEVE